jgi:predicted Zn-dependent protease with MMP-like domain
MTDADELELEPEQALAEALAWLEREPTSADAHYEAALAYDDLGERDESIREFLEVLRLDSLAAEAPLPGYHDIICSEVERTLAGLPQDFSERLGAVTILVEPRPPRALVEDGLDPRLLGLFDGATAEELASGDGPPAPTQIFIFSHNLASAFADEASLREEVAITVLHEVGHFFGLEEEDMLRLGLD